mgnify:CR=1 FL=1
MGESGRSADGEYDRNPDGGVDMSDKKMNAESLRGTLCVLLSAVCFSTGGVLIKSIPWSSVTIQGARSIFSALVVGCYMLLRRQKFVWNKTVLFGAVCNTVMAFAFVAATKLTTAANAIVLQFTEPVFVILLMWLIFHKKPGRDAVFACAGVFAGILCFFYTSLDADRIEQSVALKSCHNQHQRQQNAEHAPVNVAHVLRTRVHPECRCHSEGCGDREYRFFFYKICDLLQHVVHHLFCFIVKIPFLFYFSFLHLHRIFF